jgi:S1-C subfamily serine protease
MTRRVVPDLITEGEFEHSRMGVLLTDVTPELIEANDLPVTYGVYIDRVQDDVPADGILRGTTGQTRVRGRDVPTGGDVIVGLSNGGTEWATPTTERLSAFLALYTEPGDSIGVDVVRGGERQTVEITLVERPPPPSRA